MKKNRLLKQNSCKDIDKIATAVVIKDILKPLPACVFTSIETHYEDTEAWNSESRT
jgi:hypothetical protein